MTEFSHPLDIHLTARRRDRFETVARARAANLTVVLDGVFHEHNISAVVRSADAFGIGSVHVVTHLADTPLSGVSMGAERWVTVRRHNGSLSALETIKDQGYEIAVLEAPPHEQNEIPRGYSADAQFLPVFSLPFQGPLAVVFGAEKQGVSDIFRGAAKYAAYIPMFGFVESLNVSVAAAITLFCSTVSATEKRSITPLAEYDARLLYDQWVEREIARERDEHKE